MNSKRNIFAAWRTQQPCFEEKKGTSGQRLTSCSSCRLQFPCSPTRLWPSASSLDPGADPRSRSRCTVSLSHQWARRTGNDRKRGFCTGPTQWRRRVRRRSLSASSGSENTNGKKKWNQNKKEKNSIWFRIEVVCAALTTAVLHYNAIKPNTPFRIINAASHKTEGHFRTHINKTGNNRKIKEKSSKMVFPKIVLNMCVTGGLIWLLLQIITFLGVFPVLVNL